MKTITSDNLVIRPLVAQDQDMFCALYTDVETMKFIEPVYDQEKAINVFEIVLNRNHDINSGFNTWAILAQDDIDSVNSGSLGYVIFYNYAGKKRLKIPEIGIMLLEHARGKSIGEEIVGSMISYAFTHTKSLNINVRFDKRNLAMQRLAQKIGFNFKQSIADEALEDDISNNKVFYNNPNTRVETISSTGWQGHKHKFLIQVKEN